MGTEEIEVLRTSGTMPTMLPGAAFFLEMPYPPARAMIEGGLSVALASDFNPGSSPSGSMKMIVSLACIKMRMTPAEAINAATLNGAYAMGLSSEYGSITVGKKANFFLTTKIPSVAYLPYAYTLSLIHILSGKVCLWRAGIESRPVLSLRKVSYCEIRPWNT